MDYAFLHGQWHIIYSNFPMWLKGDKTAPSLNYHPTDKPNVLLDVVQYTENGRLKTIEGFDYADGASLRFVWRGKGWLRFLHSRWKIEHVSAAQDWLILSFEKTLFTPAGHDIVCRHASPTPAQLDEMERKFGELVEGKVICKIASAPNVPTSFPNPPVGHK
ncbi:MAG: hypothetical protein JNL09_06045 [Anaerolineales bacterium]|nr:hypothetical protein [Anaerolineales bacterium]